MTHPSRQENSPGIRTHFFAIVFVALVVLFIAMFGTSTQGAPFVSAEVQFTDVSASGMHIVPASCPSDMHYVGECTPPPQPPPLPICEGTKCGDKTDVCPNGLNRASYPTCLCPAGQVQSGSICITPTVACPNGLNISQYPSCVCPIGQTQSGNSCVTPPGGTPTGGTPTGGTCVSNVGSACSGAANICGMRNAGTIQCAGGCGATTPSNSVCPAITCLDGSSVPAGTNCSCSEGFTADGNICIPPDGPEFIGFATTKGFNASGELEVRPALVRSGAKTFVFWNVTNVRDCTVRGTNGDGAKIESNSPWNKLSSGAGGVETSEIKTRTEYTLFCRSLVGATPSTITQTRTVNVLPSWYEPQGAN